MGRERLGRDKEPLMGLHRMKIGIIILVMVLLVWYPVQAAVNTTIPCGVILPLSGDLAGPGTDLLHGIELAAEEVNARGGNDGWMLDLHIVDDHGDPATALATFREMKDAGIPVIIGSYTTDLTYPMAKESTSPDSPVLISPRANGRVLDGISPLFFQMNAPVVYLGRFLADWASYTSERVAIIYLDNDYGTSLTESITTALKGTPVVITGTEPVSDDTDFHTLSRMILDDAPDVIMFSMYGPLQISLLQNLSDAGYRGQIILTDAYLIPSLEQDYTEILSGFSICSLSSYAATVPGSLTDQFAEEFEEQYSSDPRRGIAGYGYDAVMVIRESLKHHCSTSTITADDIRKGLSTIRYYGVSGPKIFDEKNAVRPALERWVFRNGRFSLMTTSYI